MKQGLKEFSYIVTAVIVIAYFIVVAVRAQRRKARKEKIERVIDSVHRCGKVLYRDKIYVVKDVCDLSRFEGGTYKIAKDLIVTKPGDEQLYKVAIEEVEPYDGPLRPE